MMRRFNISEQYNFDIIIIKKRAIYLQSGTIRQAGMYLMYQLAYRSLN
jgi:hypothetical protein